MLLSAADLTRGRPCTTHHRVRSDFVEQGGVLKKARVVNDGDLVTAGGVTSGLDLALWLVRRELGVDAALGLESMLEYEVAAPSGPHSGFPYSAWPVRRPETIRPAFAASRGRWVTEGAQERDLPP
nr:DJ-1/PfpI family protein [Streptomyces flavidovirens]